MSAIVSAGSCLWFAFVFASLGSGSLMADERVTTTEYQGADSELASFPNSASTLPQGKWSLEWSTVSYTDGSKVSVPMASSDVLIRYGLFDPLELRIYTQGVTAQWGSNRTVGFSPLTFDLKARLLETTDESPWLPGVAFETAIQTQLMGSAAFDAGTEPTFTLNVDQPLGDFLFQYNVGTMRFMSPCNPNQLDWNLTYSWSIEREVTEDLTFFVDGFYGSSILPKVTTMSKVTPGVCTGTGSAANSYGKNGRLFGENMVGGGLFWHATPDLGFYMNVAGGTNVDSPGVMSYLGFVLSPTLIH